MAWSEIKGPARFLLVTRALLILLLSPTPAAAADRPGPSSRRTGWVFSEIHASPLPRSDGRNTAFVEIRNSGLIPEDLANHRLEGAIEFIFPPNTVVPPGSHRVIAPVPADVEAVHGISGVLGGFASRLSNPGTLRLRNPAGAVLLEVRWSPHPPWPAAAAGAGASLVLRRPSFGEADPRAWSASAFIEGSPGREDPDPDILPLTVPPVFPGGVVLNEILSHSARTGDRFVELHNTSNETRDVSGCRIRLHPADPGVVLPAGTVLAPDERRALGESLLGSIWPADGLRVSLASADGTRILDAVEVGAQALGVSFGRSPEGTSDFRELRFPTPGAANSPRLERPVILTEIQYHPLPDDSRLEYVELFNRGPVPVDLSGWRFVDGVEFEFPEGSRIGAGEYCVVAADVDRLLAAHPELPRSRVFGNFRGSLSDRGERLALAMPEDRPVLDAAGQLRFTRHWVVVEDLSYGDGGSWGRWSDGGGSSLELRDLRADRRLAASWADSDESAKAPWTVLEHTGLLDHGTGTADQLQVLPLAAGTFLIDDLQVQRSGSSANLVRNPSFDTGTNFWICRGTQSGSRWESREGATTPGSLRIEAVGRGDTGANRIETALASALTPGTTATLRARARWMAGGTEFLVRLRGSYLEAPGSLTVPSNLGTPGAPNSRAVPNPGPALHDLRQSPILPALGQPVRVTLRVEDPDDVATVVLRYRLDPGTTWTELPMLDDGTGDDARAGDGVYSVSIPGHAAGRLVAFRIRATDAAVPPRSQAWSEYPENGEALIRWGENQPPGTLGTYRLWITKSDFDRWTGRSKLDNSPVPVTFVYNAERVIHGAGALFAGSPHLSPSYTTPSGNLCGYIFVMPGDQPFLGAGELVLDWPGRDATAQQEPMAYWIARELRIPFNHRRYIRLHVNGVTETARGSVYEDAQQVNSDLVESWNPDPANADGDLYKIEQWFEYNDNLSLTQVGAPRLENYFTTGGVRKTARYRWSWLRRAAGNTAHDYSPLFTLLDAVTAGDPGVFVRRMQAFADLDEWMRIFATENIVVNLDSWGYDIGKNMYAYLPRGGRWQLHMWDIDWVMLASAQHGYSPTSPLLYRGPAVFGEGNRDPAVARLYREPAFQRLYWQAIRDAVDGPLLPERVAARMDATHAALVAEGVTRSSGSALAGPDAVKSWLAQRRTFLLSQLQTVSSGFTLASPPARVDAAPRVTLTGTAPIPLAELRVNGRAAYLQWPTVSQWSTEIALEPGTNLLQVAGFDRAGAALPGTQASAVVVYAGSQTPETGPLTLNEWQSANVTTVTDPADGDHDDWFEIHNASSSPADLTGYHLSDDPSNPRKYAIPPGTTIEPRGFLLVWADEEGSQYRAGGPLHANFKLSQSGEQILLTRYDGLPADRIDFGRQGPDVSSGRWPDGDRTSGFQSTLPTPGAPNTLPRPIDAAPVVLSVDRAPEGTLRLEWSTVPGGTYKVQFTPRLDPAAWADLMPEVVATGTASRAVDPQAVRGSRFYRIVRTR